MGEGEREDRGKVGPQGLQDPRRRRCHGSAGRSDLRRLLRHGPGPDQPQLSCGGAHSLGDLRRLDRADRYRPAYREQVLHPVPDGAPGKEHDPYPVREQGRGGEGRGASRGRSGLGPQDRRRSRRWHDGRRDCLCQREGGPQCHSPRPRSRGGGEGQGLLGQAQRERHLPRQAHQGEVRGDARPHQADCGL